MYGFSKNKMKNFLGKKLLVVVAHPDDESFAAGGTIYKNQKLGGETVVICATLGEKGMSHLKRPMTPNQLKRVRKRELLAVCRLLRAKKLITMNIPDGKVRIHKTAVYKKVVEIAKKYKFNAILGFGEDGITGHQDHIAASAAATRAAKTLRLPYLAFCPPPLFLRNAEEWMKKRRKAKHYKKKVIHKNPDIKIRIDHKMKLRAVRLHKSQLDSKHPFAGLPRKAVKDISHYEHFRQIVA